MGFLPLCPHHARSLFIMLSKRGRGEPAPPAASNRPLEGKTTAAFMGCVLRAPKILSTLLAASLRLPKAAPLSKHRPHPRVPAEETEAWKIPATCPRSQTKQQRRDLNQSAGKVLCQLLDSHHPADVPVE